MYCQYVQTVSNRFSYMFCHFIRKKKEKLISSFTRTMCSSLHLILHTIAFIKKINLFRAPG